MSHGGDAKEHLSLTFKPESLLRACTVLLYIIQSFAGYEKLNTINSFLGGRELRCVTF